MHGLAVVLLWATILGHLERNSAKVARLASHLIELSTRQNFAFWLAGGGILRGWARSASGDTAESISWIENGIADWRVTGSTLVVPYYLGLKAEALHFADRTSEALEAISEAEALTQRSEERWWSNRVTASQYPISWFTWGDLPHRTVLLCMEGRVSHRILPDVRRGEGVACLERKTAATMRDDQIFSTSLILILSYVLRRSIQSGCWRKRKGFRRIFPEGSQSPVRAVRYSIKNRQIQIGWKVGYVVQELRNRKGISIARTLKEICEKSPTRIKEGSGSRNR
jgi:hypothetical protein